MPTYRTYHAYGNVRACVRARMHTYIAYMYGMARALMMLLQYKRLRND